MTRTWVLLCLLLAAPAYAGTYDLSPPLTSDSTGCGSADGAPDFDHYLIHFYRCRADSLVRRQPPLKPLWVARRDSVVFTHNSNVLTLPDSLGGVGWIQVWSVDGAGNKSCGYLSATWASPAVAAVVQPPPDTASTGITGRYYRGMNRDHFIASRRDTSIAFMWGTGSPWIDVPADSFSVEWDGKIAIPTAGAWTFYVTSEDGIQFYIDWTYSINAYAVSPLQERSKSMTLTAGLHDLHLNYMARLGNSECTLRWSGPGVAKAIIPRSALR